MSALCNRVSFMYGIPYHHRKLVEVIHGTDKVGPQLQEQFGAIPLAMYLNAARNLRAGQALIVDEDLREVATPTRRWFRIPRERGFENSRSRWSPVR